MRFISKSARLHAGNYRNAEQAISEAKVVVIDGRSRAVQPEPYTVTAAIPIQFSQEGLLQTDIDAALAHWRQFEGLPTEEDRITPYNPVEVGRIGVWDSVAWQHQYKLADREREEAERMLLESPFNGAEFFAAEETRAAKPWPSYDDMHHQKIAAFAAEADLVEAALAYERENKERPSVIQALEEQLHEPALAGAEEEVILA